MICCMCTNVTREVNYIFSHSESGVMCFRFLWSYLGHNSSICDCPTCRKFFLWDKEDFVCSWWHPCYYPWAIQSISFANDFPQMDFIDPLIRCMYSRDAPVVGSITTLSWCCPCVFFDSTEMCCAVGSTIITWYTRAVVLYQCVARDRSYLFPLQWPRSCCCTSYFIFSVYFPLFAADGGVAWYGMGVSEKYLPRFILWVHPWRWGYLMSQP